MSSGRIGEIVEIFRLAAVVDEQECPENPLPKALQ
jgi:hypothetical protein